jgi:hypothetical protein
MTMLDKLRSMLKGHEDQAHQGVDKAGDAFDKRTGDKYASQTEKVKQQVDEQLDRPAQSPNQQP